ncbi:SDR family oxidoreductase [soil metagenome]
MKFTLITGASSGIGEAFAKKLAEKKHNLVLVARSETKLLELCDELMLKHKITAHYIALDLTEFEADKKLFEETEKHGFKIEWLINNAGFGSMGDFAELDLKHELGMIDLNISALLALTHRYLPKMRERKSGVIINVSSAASFQPIPFMATYAATKAFVTSYSQAIAEENRPFGIKILALCPGATETNFFNAAGMNEAFQVKGIQTPEEVVETALKAIKKGKSLVVSGLANYIGSVLGTIVPDSLITKTIGKVLRSKVKKNN